MRHTLARPPAPSPAPGDPTLAVGFQFSPKTLPRAKFFPCLAKATCANVPTTPSQPPTATPREEPAGYSSQTQGRRSSPETTKISKAAPIFIFFLGGEGEEAPKINAKQMFLPPTLGTPQLEQPSRFSLALTWAQNARSRLQEPRPVKPEVPKEGVGIFGSRKRRNLLAPRCFPWAWLCLSLPCHPLLFGEIPPTAPGWVSCSVSLFHAKKFQGIRFKGGFCSTCSAVLFWGCPRDELSFFGFLFCFV